MSTDAATPPFPRHHDTFNHLWAALMLEELQRLGVRDIVLAPGSRSSPLIMAAAAHPGFHRHRHFDERGLGFLALGLAKGSRRPVAIITTSGTAVANLHPAVIEASQSGVPLVLLCADRPVELIDNGSNQAIDQRDMFARHVVFHRDLPSPTPDIAAAFVLSTLDQALAHQRRHPGPVHLNCRYPEPLYPGERPIDASAYLAPLGNWLGTARPWSPWEPVPGGCSPLPDWQAFQARPGLVVAGCIDDPAEGRWVAALAERLGWPLVADLQSQIRFDGRNLRHVDLALHDDAFVDELRRAEVLLQFGARLISKRLGRFIAWHTWRDYWLVDPHPSRLDPDHRVRRRLVCRPSEFIAAHPSPSQSSPPSAPWHRLAERQARTSAAVEAACSHFSEVGICHRLARLVHGQLMVGNSLPARLMEMLGTTGAGPSRVTTNRGASGIDGLIATACGFALSRDEPTTLLLGDISALHDLNSLALLGQASHPLVVILLNNDGGSIFRLLPVPCQEGLLESDYLLPHGLSFEHAAAMFGLGYAAPTTLDEFETCYAEALQSGATLIEIKVPGEQVAEDIEALGASLRER
ncbi:2-succinyl-5-enolpyruvyl-6-hydroxy-3-cyclohexene-1-carboxylic-acid synthase [Billgrantia endophytica]|uniref:2-succinyl-5-enolpyruvyl-6-hydroxy-3-cyclohexene-1-carboxylate synthase n=1 Tax=Billgrantia endophytica TaxID=2033802 RepID=A0A2N7U3U2_9GAMM|nr:2-succinyl-5-enolpyruvyl-6-hydroxy-3-cyclohexene-1-carboxylic-acid synthase [Halomonas endophytica]PMR75101.1 2-succinyl-5-enolpyruvyl-6-hydroxy-3-cyclohexene-1-carboxylic-acid synthase [Halomonas endophytica]